MKTFIPKVMEQMVSAFESTCCTGAGRKKLELSAGIEAAYKLLEKAGKGGKKVILVGNGGSLSIASHIAVDLWKNGGLRATAFTDPSLLTCISNDYGFEHVYEVPIEMFAEKGDVLIAISSSGKSENILRAVAAAAKKGCAVITMSGFSENNPLRSKGAVNFHVPSGGYGFVETAHAALCHCLVDSVIENRRRSRAG